jgi:hypothetical protein
VRRDWEVLIAGAWKVLEDRKVIDANMRDDIVRPTRLRDVLASTRDKAAFNEHLPTSYRSCKLT